MKKIFMVAVLVALAVPPEMVTAATSVVNSKHDMIATGHATASGGAATEVCIFCHTPHGAQTSEPLVPLWNNTAVASVSGFYTSPTTNFQSTQASINATDARLCLACHDGGVTGPTNGPNVGSIVAESPTTMSASALLGITMSNDHPIGMDLTATSETNPVGGGDSGIRTIAEITTSFGENPFFGGVDDLDPINIMYCSTCHNVHDNTNVPFLRKDNYGSALCKACHKK